jgi:pimeloyl-ACP methyl ester carboxylesterase
MGIREARLIARAIRLTSNDRARFPTAVTEVYRQNAARKGGLTAMLNWYRALLRGGGLRRCRDSGFPKIQVPTLLLWGGADNFFTAQAPLGTDDFVSDLTDRLLPGVSHWVQQEGSGERDARSLALGCARSGIFRGCCSPPVARTTPRHAVRSALSIDRIDRGPRRATPGM